MANKNKKFSSVNSQSAQAVRNNQNTTEILTKIDQALNSNDSYVTLKVIDSNGKEVISQFPTIGYLKQELDRITKTVNILSGIEGNPASVQIAQNAYKRIITADLNLEPKKIDNLDPVSIFKTNPNWIFDSFLNPKISVELDLTNKIDKSIRKVQCRRFIIEFDKTVTVDAQGNEVINYTTAGQARLDEFNTLYKGKSNIDMIEFVQWMQQVGVVNRIDNTLIDEDYFRIEPNILKYKGDFNVLHTEVDVVNKKLWYALDSLTYYDVSDPDSPPAPVQLKVGDLVNVNPNLADVVSTTVYKVIEISTVTSDLRVRFEQVYGEEPIPVRINALSFYSETLPERKVRISIGFDERNVLFVRAFDEDNNLQGKDWSSGIGFYTNELTLDNSNGEQFSEYYVKQVYDYGLAIEDLVQKKIPNYYGIKPNAPVLNQDNFKVVQINQHLTNTVDAERIRDLHNNKNDLTSQISQLQTQIESKNRFLETTVFNSQAERKRAQDELVTLQSKLTNKNETKYTIVKDILASKKNLNKIDPKFKIRGFWPMPDAVTTTKTTPQEVVQFEIWYRYLNKSGAENPISTFPDIINSAAQLSSSQNTTVNANLTRPNKVNAAYSNWIKYKTDARKRIQDPLTGQWKWVIEDVQDANTPNINQLDISISPGERVEIKIKSLSEVGWPETPVESDFSDLLTIDFPDDLNNILSDDQFILKEASADDLKVNFERDLEARGLGLHLNSAIRADNIYYAHNASVIASGFKDLSTGSIINLYDQLLLMVNKITSLEEQLARGKGELEVYIINKGVKTKVFNGNSLTFNLNLEDFMIKTKIGILGSEVDNGARCYENKVYVIENFVLEIRNGAQSTPLGLLANRNYAQIPGALPSTFAWNGDTSPQAIWADTNNQILYTDNITTNLTLDTVGPRRATQTNNQWIWLQNKDVSGADIYEDDRITNPAGRITGLDAPSVVPTNWNFAGDLPTTPTGLVNQSNRTLVHPTKNLGFFTNKQISSVSPINAGTPITSGTPTAPSTFDISDDKNWSWMLDLGAPTFSSNTKQNIQTNVGACVIPVINSFQNIIDNSTQQLKTVNPGDSNAIQIPIKIYFRPYLGTILNNPNFGNIAFPLVTSTTEFIGSTNIPTYAGNVITGGKLRINTNGSTASFLKAGDKIVLTGTGDANLDNKPIVVTNIIGGTDILTNYPYTTPFTGAATIAQVHLYTTTTGAVTMFKQFSVYSINNDMYVKNYIEFYSSSATPSPQVLARKLRFYLETETSARPIEFQFNWNLTHYKRVSIINNASSSVNAQSF